MPALTIKDLNDVKEDLDHIAVIATSLAPTATDRLGHVKPTISGATNALAAKVADVEAHRVEANAIIAETAYAVIGITDRGVWEPLLAYATKDIVLVDGTWYVCVVAHNSGEVFAADKPTKWRVYQGVTSGDLADALALLRIGWMQRGDGSVLRTAYDKMAESISVADKGAVCDGITDDSAALRATQLYAGRRAIAFIGVMHIASPVTITSPILDTMEQIFSETSQVTISNGQPIRPEWFGSTGGNILRAVAATPPPGGVIRLENAVYPPQGIAYGFASAGNFITKKGIKIDGAKLPNWASDCRSMEGGTIIEGMLGVYADNFEMCNVGIDSGYNVINKYAGGVITPGQGDGLICTYPDDATKAASPLRRGLRLHNVRSLVLSPTAPVHGMILGEGYAGVNATGVTETCFGQHGAVIKCSQVHIEQLTSYGSGGEGVVIKSDAQVTSIAGDIQIGRIATYASGPVGWNPYAVATTGVGVMFNPQGRGVGVCQIGSIADYGHPSGVASNIADGMVLDNVQIGSVTGEGNVYATVAIVAPPTGSILRTSIGQISSRNSGTGLRAEWTVGQGVLTVGDLSAVNCNVAMDLGANAVLMVDKVIAAACSSGAIRLRDNGVAAVGGVIRLGGTPSVYAGDGGGHVPALSAGWEQVAGSEEFTSNLAGFGIVLGGLVKPLAGGSVAQLPVFARPSTAKRVMAQGFNGSVISAVPVIINESGVITANEVAGDHANCSTWLSLSGISYLL